MPNFLKQFLSSLLRGLRKMMGGRLPSFLGRYPNRLQQILPATIEGDFCENVKMRFDLSDRIQFSIFINGTYYENDDIQFVVENCAGPDTVFLDIGANVGVYSFAVASAFPSASIYSFEPNPRTFAKLEETKSLGSFPGLNLYQVALADTAGKAILHTSNVNSGWATLGNRTDLPGAVAVEIPMIRFDDWWEEKMHHLSSTKLFVIKMDVEGFETNALRGMARFLTNSRIKLIQVEFFDPALRDAGSSPQELFDLLTSFGFQGHTGRNLSIVASAPPPAAEPVNVYFSRN